MITEKKTYQLQYVKLGLPANTKDIRIGHVLRTEVFDSLKEVNFVIKKLSKKKGFENHGNILLCKSKLLKVNINIE